MSKVFGTLSQINIRGAIAKRLLGAYIVDVIKVGIAAYLETATSIIPVWSGASQGAFQSVAELIGEHIPQFTQLKAPDRWHIGLAAGQADIEINKGSGVFKFIHNIDVEGELFYLELNEKYNMNPLLRPLNDPSKPLHEPGPYNFRQLANEAFDAAVRAELASFNFLAFLTKNVTVTQKALG